jgi:very-short-patch-repair endonuclease
LRRSRTNGRTLIDLGSVVRSDALETALERALLARVTTFDRLLRRFFELAAKGRPGIAALRSLLVERDPTLAPAESDLETLLFKILRDGGLPAPVRQHVVEIGGHCFYLDAAYPELMIFMEGDGFGVHAPRDPFERDRSRQNLLVVAGWLPLRFTWRRLCRVPEGVVGEVHAARVLRQRLIS